MKYNFLKMNEKAVFDAKLRNEIVDFGFIPVWYMRRFLEFCIKHGFLYHPPTYREHAYLVKHKFKYNFSGSKVCHLPFGRTLEWIADAFYDSTERDPLRGYVLRHSHTVAPRGTRIGFNYVTWYEGLIV